MTRLVLVLLPFVFEINQDEPFASNLCCPFQALEALR